MDLHKLQPSDLRERLLDWRKNFISDADIDSILGSLEKMVDGYATVTTSLNASYIYRVRKNRNDQLYSYVSELWYPPAHLVSSLGRANLIGEVVLYAADSESTALKELGIKVGDKYTLLVSELNSPENNDLPHVFVIGNLTSAYAGNDLLRNSNNKQTVKLLRHFLGRSFESSLLIDEFIANVFKERNSRFYALTNAIAKFYLKSDLVDGIVYPSVQASGLNIALKPQSADRFYKPYILHTSEIVKEHGAQGGMMARCLSKVQKIDDAGSLTWSRPLS